MVQMYRVEVGTRTCDVLPIVVNVLANCEVAQNFNNLLLQTFSFLIIIIMNDLFITDLCTSIYCDK